MTDPWTYALNKVFEQALAIYDQHAPDYWQNVARAVGGGITVEEVIRHYAELHRDLNNIATTDPTLQDGGSGSGNSRGESSRSSSSHEAQRQERL